MGDLSVNGLRCASARLTIPRYGPWTADVQLATDAGPKSGEVATLKIGAMTFEGSCRRSAVFTGDLAARLVGGRGGWRKVLPPRSYSHEAGVKKSAVIADAAREAGEPPPAVSDDRIVGQAYVRDRAKAEHVLRMLAGGVWYVDEKGVTQVRERDSSRIATPFTVVKRDGASGQVEVATESYQDWQPGRRFVAPTVPDELEVSAVTLTASNDGKVRLVVLPVDEARERLLADVRAIVRAEMAETVYAGVWEYEVAAATDKTFDGVPTDARMPAIKGCPFFPGPAGERVAPSIGSRCLVAFVNADPARPVCVGVRGRGLEHLMTVEATALLIHNFMGALCAANGMFIGPAIAPQIAAALNLAIAAAGQPASGQTAEQQVASAAAEAAAMAAGAPGKTSALYAAAIAAALGQKTVPNLSGLYPGAGMPSQEV